MNPVHATEIGYHAFDDRWPDLTDAGREASLGLADRCPRAVDGIAADDLTRDQAIDRRILRSPGRGPLRRGNAGRSLVEPAHLRLPVRQRPVQPAGTRVRPGRRPAAKRRRRACDALPDALDQARDRLLAGGNRPVSRLHTEKAVERMPGLLDLTDSAVEEAQEAGRPEPAGRGGGGGRTGPRRRHRLHRLAARRAAAAGRPVTSGLEPSSTPRSSGTPSRPT